MTKDDIGVLIGEELLEILKLQAANNGLSKVFEHYLPLMIATSAVAANNITKMLIEKKIINVD